MFTFVKLHSTQAGIVQYVINTSSPIQAGVGHAVIDILACEGGCGGGAEPRSTAALKVTGLRGGGAGGLTQLGGVTATMADIPEREKTPHIHLNIQNF